jgi:hypothetical protein
MSFVTGSVVIVAIIAVSIMYRERLKAESKQSEEFYNDLVERMNRLEDRMANLETIVLDKEKTKGFSGL